LTIVGSGLVFADNRTVLAATITSGVTPVLAAWTLLSGWTVLPGGTLPPGWTGAVVAILAAGIGVAVLWRALRVVVQTTLIDAWWWAAGALVLWCATEVAAALQPPGGTAGWVQPARLLAISLSLCPMIAVMGAKRPQHGPWNFVVLSLFAIVALPAAEAFFLKPGQRVVVGDARSWFLWILVLLGPINYVPTRFWLAALLVAAGQIIALSPHLALIQRAIVAQGELVGLVFCAAGLLAAWTASGSAKRVASPGDRLWLDFRDCFGLFWGLRVQERVNAAALSSGWGWELAWQGFVCRTNGKQAAESEGAKEPAVWSTLKGLLRRFVSNEWIAERLESPID
jgi:hypothetical protein